MSIIYEALKKAEAQGAKQPINDKLMTPKARPGMRMILVYILVIIAAIFMMNLFYKLISTSHPAKPAIQSVPPKVNAAPLPIQVKNPSPEVPVVPEAQGPVFTRRLDLNGVFYSGSEAYALMNNQIIKVGDIIEGAIVKRISLEGVELEKDGQLVQIPTSK